MGVFKDLINLIRGMGITGKHLGRHAVTIQYPEEKWEMPEGSRGIVVLLSDKETGELNCTACLLCMKACPTAAIRIDAPRGEDKKRHLQKFDIDFGLCCFCGLCEEACNFSAIKMASKYEFSSLTQGETIWDMNKLQDVGRDVDYVDTRKKKKPAAAKPAPKPSADKATKDETSPAKSAEDKTEAAAAEKNKPPVQDKPATDEKSADKIEPASDKKDKPRQEESDG